MEFMSFNLSDFTIYLQNRVTCYTFFYYFAIYAVNLRIPTQNARIQS